MKNCWRLLPLILLSSCASAPPKAEGPSVPAWVSHPEQAYPAQRYLSSVGIGNGRDEAIRDAKRQMAESFMVKVKSTTSLNAESKLDQNTSGSVSGAASQNVNKSVDLESVARLRGAEVKEVAQVGSDTYALLALDKLAARSGLLLDVNRVQARMNSNLEGLESGFNGQKMKELQADLEELRALSGEASALGMSALTDASSIESRVQVLQNRMRAGNEKKSFRVRSLKGDERFSRGIEECLQDRGAKTYTGEKVPEGTRDVEVSVIEQPQHLQIEGWVKSRFVVTANVIDPSGRSVRSSSEKLESARSRDALLEAVAGEIAADLCEKVWNRLGEMK
ncbi:MAG: hypothetical protein EBX52_06470 [Proteobacteria bacterium]|nr:hypothetical protein [Pseudomonadota bacterium]